MKKISIFALIASLFVSAFAVADEVNVFNARHYKADAELYSCLLYTSPSPRDVEESRMPSSA